MALDGEFNASPYSGTWSGIKYGDIKTLQRGPDEEHYWDVWETILNNAKLTCADGVIYTIHQDDDVWLIPQGWENTEEGAAFLGIDPPQPEEDEEEPAPKWWYLNLYLTNRAYGGPEEGGWWYDYYCPEQLPDVAPCYGPFATEEEARTKREEIKPLLDIHNGDRRSDVNSVISDGCYVLLIEGHLPKHQPETKPHYE
jgi:hypothetical protein